MSYINKFDRDGQCSVDGEYAENSFGKLLSLKGKIRPATKAEQFRHIDFVLDDNGKLIKYDVKAQKRLSRQDDEVNNDLIWVEFLSVTGNPGWLYGEANYIVFERAKDFVIVDRNKLREMCEIKCDLALMVTSSQNALYKGYRRFMRKDLISIVLMTDILPIAHEIWQK